MAFSFFTIFSSSHHSIPFNGVYAAGVVKEKCYQDRWIALLKRKAALSPRLGVEIDNDLSL